MIEQELIDRYNATVRNRCDNLLRAMVGNPDLCTSWWKGPNKGFDGLTPEEVFEKNPLRVYNYLAGHAFIGGGS